MGIKITLDLVMKEKMISSNELAEKLDISGVNLSLLKNGKVKGIRLETLNLICQVLECQPGDIIKYID